MSQLQARYSGLDRLLGIEPRFALAEPRSTLGVNADARFAASNFLEARFAGWTV